MIVASKAIRKYCVEFCCYNQTNEVRLCVSSECSLYPYRLGKKSEKTKLSRIQSIKVRCRDCYGYYTVKCEDKECFLYPYRAGKNPNLKGRKNNSSFGKANTAGEPI
jgi:hypothetical protein